MIFSKGFNMKTKIALLSFLTVFSLSSAAFACSAHDEADAKKNSSDKKQAETQSDARAQLGLSEKQVSQDSANKRLPFERHGKSSMTRERVLKN